MLPLEPVEPRPLVGPGQFRRGALGELQHRGGVAGGDRVGLAAARQHLGGELADRLEHPEPRLARAAFVEPDEALVDQRAQTVDDVASPISSAGPQTASAISSSKPPRNTDKPIDQALCSPSSSRS